MPANRKHRNLREPIPALVKRNGYEGHIRHRLVSLRHRARSSQDAGAVAHMSLHLKPTMSKIQPTTARRQKLADNHRSPFLATRGTSCPSCWRPLQPAETVCSAAVRGPLRNHSDSVKPLFQKSEIIGSRGPGMAEMAAFFLRAARPLCGLPCRDAPRWLAPPLRAERSVAQVGLEWHIHR